MLGRSRAKVVVLDEKCFRRLGKFKRDNTLCRSWLFDLLMAFNQNDSELAKEVNKVINECEGEGEKWEHDGKVEPGIWKKYHSELYAVISGLTEGTAKMALKGTYDRDRTMDGLKALAVFQARFDIQTVGGMLQALVDVVKPGVLKESNVVDGTR